ncbi:MAG: 2,3-bisphosphoglycerate-independent phosphoglycerate mutase [Firmicutes bacterium]|nr:2,3-bisphosphoglycerate-independent phosphoglycerate mutase [Bacillota bacterium]
MQENKERFLALIILDGWGLRESREGNAIALARTPFMDGLYKKFPFTRLMSSGEAVGLPENQMGNSEVGHLNLGAGRIVYQDMLRISKSIEGGDFFRNEVILDVLEKVKKNNSTLHLMGLLSDGGVHSHNTHLYALLELAKMEGLDNVSVHAILDGRDTPPKSAARYLKELEQKMGDLKMGRVASVAGRYYSMDRDRRWDRTEKAYRAYIYGEGKRAENSLAALEAAYLRKETDEFVTPTLILNEYGRPSSLINNGDGLIFFNFRADRARQISSALVDKNFHDFERGASPSFPYYVTFTEYDPFLKIPVVFPPEYLSGTLGEIISKAGFNQLRIAETEKYAHVTYFFNGGREEAFPGEDRILVPSPHVPTYDLKPEMSASEITDEVLEALRTEKYLLIVINYANADMVGHTGDLQAAVKAVEVVDRELGRVVSEILQRKGAAIVTADHGNAEKMSDEDGSMHTAHTRNETPFILVSTKAKHTLLPRGKLADVAPTILKLLSLPVSPEMSGSFLF